MNGEKIRNSLMCKPFPGEIGRLLLPLFMEARNSGCSFPLFMEPYRSLNHRWDNHPHGTFFLPARYVVGKFRGNLGNTGVSGDFGEKWLLRMRCIRRSRECAYGWDEPRWKIWGSPWFWLWYLVFMPSGFPFFRTPKIKAGLF